MGTCAQALKQRQSVPVVLCASPLLSSYIWSALLLGLVMLRQAMALSRSSGVTGPKSSDRSEGRMEITKNLEGRGGGGGGGGGVREVGIEHGAARRPQCRPKGTVIPRLPARCAPVVLDLLHRVPVQRQRLELRQLAQLLHLLERRDVVGVQVQRGQVRAAHQVLRTHPGSGGRW